MVQSLPYRSDMDWNVSFVSLPANGAGCSSSAHAYVHNFNFAHPWFEFMSNARG